MVNLQNIGISRKKIISWIVAVIFLIFISSPFLLFILNSRIKTAAIVDNHSATTFPVFSFNKDSIKRFFLELDKFFNENFIFRDSIIKAYSRFLVFDLTISPTLKVILGKSRWLFYDGENNEHVIDNYYRGLKPFTKEELARINRIFEERSRWLKSRGIYYLLVIAPNKESIYSEYLPDYLRHKMNNMTRLDQLLVYMHNNSNVHVIDLRKVLLQEKSNEKKLYFSSDTHWNDLGAYYGYREIIKHLPKKFNLSPEPISAFTMSAKKFSGMDLANMLNLSSDYDETDITLVSKSNCKSEIVDWGPKTLPDYQKVLAMRCESKQQAGVVMFRDSFASALISFMAPHFSKSTYLWSYDLDPDLIKKEKPEIVIQEVVERSIGAMSENKFKL